FQLLAICQRTRVFRPRCTFDELQTQMVCEQLLKSETALCGMAAFSELLQPGLTRRMVNIAQGFFQRRQSQRLDHMRRQPVANRRILQLTQRLGDQCTQASLWNTFRAGVDWRQRLFELLVQRTPVFRMDDLQAERSSADLAEAADPGAACESVL